MTVPSDPYNFTNGTTADGDQVDARFAPLYAALNGALDVDNVLDAVLEKLGLTDGATVRRGASIIATEESRTNTAYGTLTTADRVSGVVLPANGLIVVAYQALLKSSGASTGAAAIFLGSNQLKAQDAATRAPVVQESISGNAGVYGFLSTFDAGLHTTGTGAGDQASDVTTGQVVGGYSSSRIGGPCLIFAAAGTYDVSVQFKASSGSVSAKGRKLWVWTVGF